VIVRRLIVPLTMAVLAFHAIEARAQSASPGASVAPQSDSAFPPVNRAAPTAVIGGAPSAFPSNGAPPVGGLSQPGPQAAAPGGEDCMAGFMPLRQEAEKRGAMIKAASERHAPPDEACKLIGNFAQSEIKMIKYVEAQAQKCGVPAQVAEQMKTGHKNTENMLKKVCDAAKEPGVRNRNWLKIADRLRLSWKPLTFEGLILAGLVLEGSILEGSGTHQTLSEELS
jgi:hypothetical protein